MISELRSGQNAQKLMLLRYGCILISLWMTVSSCGPKLPDNVQLAYDELPTQVDFNRHVKPILSDKCYACHGPDLNKLKAGLELHSSDKALSAIGLNGTRIITPGNLSASNLYHRIISEDPQIIMPPRESNLTMSNHEKAVLIKWIEQGAIYEPHWAFQRPQKINVPNVDETDIAHNEVDHFILSSLKTKQLSAQVEADRETLIRRVTFDLTGLPPTLDEIDEFINDESSDAYEKVVERLLSTPQYGEHMAVNWMDLARYADTHGYTVDRYRPMWRWRDWVIKSFNENMPYDQFVTWQLAGDLMPNPTKEQILATGFNRNHAQNMEGGIVNEEYRIEYVADRTNTFGKAFLAMSFECARCHDHKFDPISQQEYFEVFSFFNQVDEVGQISWDDATPVPTMLISDGTRDSIIELIDQKIFSVQSDIEKSIEVHEVPTTTINLRDRLDAHFSFDKLVNNGYKSSVNYKDEAYMSLPTGWNQDRLSPTIVDGVSGKAFETNGDDPLFLGTIGAFSRGQPFSVTTWVKIPPRLTDGTIFHKGEGAIIYNFRGYHLALRNNKLEVVMAHTWPYNNIVKVSKNDIPRDRWAHLSMTYNGSSTAAGLKVFLNGELVKMDVEKDNLYKDIYLTDMDSDPGLRFGARWRGKGVKGTAFDEIRVYRKELTNAEIKSLAIENYQLTAADEKELFIAQERKKYVEKLTKLRKEKNHVVEDIPEIMVMDELEHRRPTYLLDRGAYDSPANEVEEGTPISILPFTDEFEKNRLGLANWLFNENNPLTARVVVNRYWQSYFGQGLVKSSDDFGNQGTLPSHPELLDWLALDFVNSGWNVKELQKKIVMSATYRQSSEPSNEVLAVDINNTWLSHGPSIRLTSEMIRDQALYASDLLNPEIGGESVYPYQPEGLWKIGGANYEQGSGNDLYRRSLYTIWKRTVPPPSMDIFDAPTRANCEIKRQKTSTPLQSLALLNDPQIVEAGRAAASKVLDDITDHDDRLHQLFRLMTSRRPSQSEFGVLSAYFQNQLEEFKKNSGKMDGWLTVGEYRSDHDPIQLAAYTTVANMILNLDAAIIKR